LSDISALIKAAEIFWDGIKKVFEVMGELLDQIFDIAQKKSGKEKPKQKRICAVTRHKSSGALKIKKFIPFSNIPRCAGRRMGGRKG